MVVKIKSPFCQGIGVRLLPRTNILHGPCSLGSWVRGGPYSLREYGPPDRKLGRTVYPMTPVRGGKRGNLPRAPRYNRGPAVQNCIVLWYKTVVCSLNVHVLRMYKNSYLANLRGTPPPLVFSGPTGPPNDMLPRASLQLSPALDEMYVADYDNSDNRIQKLTHMVTMDLAGTV